MRKILKYLLSKRLNSENQLYQLHVQVKNE